MSKKNPYNDLYVDQYGYTYYASSVKELRSKIARGGSKVSKMYTTLNKNQYHIGYVIGGHWLRKYEVSIKMES